MLKIVVNNVTDRDRQIKKISAELMAKWKERNEKKAKKNYYERLQKLATKSLR